MKPILRIFIFSLLAACAISIASFIYFEIVQNVELSKMTDQERNEYADSREFGNGALAFISLIISGVFCALGLMAILLNSIITMPNNIPSHKSVSDA
jgi:hypothetical protein